MENVNNYDFQGSLTFTFVKASEAGFSKTFWGYSSGAKMRLAMLLFTEKNEFYASVLNLLDVYS